MKTGAHAFAHPRTYFSEKKAKLETGREHRDNVDMTKHQPSRNLHPEARELIESLEQEFVFDPSERVLLGQAAQALSLSLEASAILDKEGMTVRIGRGGGLKGIPA
jgi:hypothetical protein